MQILSRGGRVPINMDHTGRVGNHYHSSVTYEDQIENLYCISNASMQLPVVQLKGMNHIMHTVWLFKKVIWLLSSGILVINIQSHCRPRITNSE